MQEHASITVRAASGRNESAARELAALRHRRGGHCVHVVVGVGSIISRGGRQSRLVVVVSIIVLGFIDVALPVVKEAVWVRREVFFRQGPRIREQTRVGLLLMLLL